MKENHKRIGGNQLHNLRTRLSGGASFVGGRDRQHERLGPSRAPNVAAG